MEKKSAWLAEGPVATYPTLEGCVDADICIVGAGITGLTSALLLKRMGKKVVVLDKGEVGGGETGKTTAHLTEILDERYFKLIERFGEKTARLIRESKRAAIRQIEEFVSLYEIDCNFQRIPGYLFSEKQDDFEDLEKEALALAKLGTPVRLTANLPLPFAIEGALEIASQAQFSPLRYLRALAKEVNGEGSYVFERSRITSDIDAEPRQIETEYGRVMAQNTIVAAHVPINTMLYNFPKLAAYRSYAIGCVVNLLKEPNGLFWDCEDPYHYIRAEKINGERILIVGGEDRKTGTDEEPEDRFKALMDYVEKRFDLREVKYRWSGQIIETADSLPYIGRNSFSDCPYIATGFSGNGMTYGTLAAMIITDHINSVENPWAEIYDAKRIHPFIAAPHILSEGKDFVYYFVKDRIAAAEEVQGLNRGEGGIAFVDGQKLAVYKEMNGSLAAYSPVCPHLGCHVHWNNAEKSWDCPCHGSRFNCHGGVLNGPAVSDLKRIPLRGENEGEEKVA